jgi:hypothetical protein
LGERVGKDHGPLPVVDGVAVPYVWRHLDAEHQATLLAVSRLVRDGLPGVRVKPKWTVPFYYVNGPICYVNATRGTRRVSIGFVKGTALADPDGLLRGTGRSPIRKLEIKAGAPVPATALRRLLRRAAKLDAESPVRWD